MFSQYLAALEDDLVLPQAFLLKCGLVAFHAQSLCLKPLFTGWRENPTPDLLLWWKLSQPHDRVNPDPVH